MRFKPDQIYMFKDGSMMFIIMYASIFNNEWTQLVHFGDKWYMQAHIKESDIRKNAVLIGELK